MAQGRAPHSADGTRPASTTAAMDLTALVRAHHAAVYRYACRLCGCPTEAEDLTQQTFLLAQQRLHQLRDPDRACCWLFAILRNCYLKSIRKTRPQTMENVDWIAQQCPVETPQLDQIDGIQLGAAVAELPDDFRLVLLMFYFEELSYHEIAQELDVPIGTVMSRLSRAKGHLRRRLAPELNEPQVAALPRPAASARVGKPESVRTPA
jgi:RNA polymerase sigma-70 factor, ECF subfamily